MSTRRIVEKFINTLEGWTLREMIWDEDIWHIEIDTQGSLKEEDAEFGFLSYPYEIQEQIKHMQSEYDKWATKV